MTEQSEASSRPLSGRADDDGRHDLDSIGQTGLPAKKKRGAWQKLRIWFGFTVLLGGVGFIFNLAFLASSNSQITWTSVFRPSDVLLWAAICAASAAGDLMMATVPRVEGRAWLIFFVIVSVCTDSFLYGLYRDSPPPWGWIIPIMLLASVLCGAFSVAMAAGR